MTGKPPGPNARRLLPVVADLVCVLVFAAAGKSSHEATSSEWVVLAIAWPYALSVLVAHAGVFMRGGLTRRTWPEGVIVLVTTYVLGMALRALSGRGLAVGFLIVAAVFLTLTMLGWRVILRLATRRRASRALAGRSDL